jgi:hypothetical protein
MPLIVTLSYPPLSAPAHRQRHSVPCRSLSRSPIRHCLLPAHRQRHSASCRSLSRSAIHHCSLPLIASITPSHAAHCHAHLSAIVRSPLIASVTPPHPTPQLSASGSLPSLGASEDALLSISLALPSAAPDLLSFCCAFISLSFISSRLVRRSFNEACSGASE